VKTITEDDMDHDFDLLLDAPAASTSPGDCTLMYSNRISHPGLPLDKWNELVPRRRRHAMDMSMLQHSRDAK
jgi:hypothetical protein